MSEPVSSIHLNFNYSLSDFLYIVNACIHLAHLVSSVALWAETLCLYSSGVTDDTMSTVLGSVL